VISTRVDGWRKVNIGGGRNSNIDGDEKINCKKR